MYSRYRFLAGIYLIWIIAGILLICAKIGLIPLYEIVEQTVIVGAIILMAIGTIQILVRGVARLQTLIENHQ